MVVLGVWEKRDGGWGERKCGAGCGKWKRGRESDLKIGHERPKTEYIRTYLSTFDRTRAECMGQMSHAFERT